MINLRFSFNWFQFGHIIGWDVAFLSSLFAACQPPVALKSTMKRNILNIIKLCELHNILCWGEKQKTPNNGPITTIQVNCWFSLCNFLTEKRSQSAQNTHTPPAQLQSFLSRTRPPTQWLRSCLGVPVSLTSAQHNKHRVSPPHSHGDCRACAKTNWI